MPGISRLLIAGAAACALSIHAFAQEAEVAFPPVLTLQAAQQLALAQNPTLQAAERRIEQARQRVKQATASFYPSIDLNIRAAQIHLPHDTLNEAQGAAAQAQLTQLIFSALNPNSSPLQVLFSPSGMALEDDIEQYSASVSATWILFNGFGRYHARQAARFGAQQTEAARDEAQRLLFEGVAQAFHGAQLARENIGIAEADLAFNERLLKEANARRNVGAGSLSDVLNFEVRKRVSEAALLNAQRDREIALIGLAALMAVSEAELPADQEIAPLPPLSDTSTPPSTDVDALVATALDMRPDVAAQQAALQRADAAIGLRKAPFYPTVALSAGREATGDRNFRFDENDFNTSIGIGLSYNLFAGGRDKAQLAEAKAAQREAEHLLLDAELTAAKEVRRSFQNLQTAYDQLELQRDTTEFVRHNRDLVEKEYNAGQASLVRLNEAQRDLISADGRLALARVSLESARHTLRTATAETLDRVGE